MERLQTRELLQRSLALRHKIKVHESAKAPETHEDLALNTLAKWELEDELKAIEELLAENRKENVVRKRLHLEKVYMGPGAGAAASAKDVAPAGSGSGSTTQTAAADRRR